jgi:hypothetical protein
LTLLTLSAAATARQAATAPRRLEPTFELLPTRNRPRDAADRRAVQPPLPAYWANACVIIASRNTTATRLVGITTIQKALFFQNGLMALVRLPMPANVPIKCPPTLVGVFQS